jgi:hypothetical protein
MLIVHLQQAIALSTTQSNKLFAVYKQLLDYRNARLAITTVICSQYSTFLRCTAIVGYKCQTLVSNSHTWQILRVA